MNKEKLIGLKTSEVKELLDKRGIEYLDEVEKKLTFKETSGYIVDIKEDEQGRLVLYESNRKMLVFIIILIALIVGLASTLGNGIYESIKEQIIEITGVIGKPELEAGKEWSKEGLVRVVKDAKSSKQISFYEYCVREDTKEECNWKETHTKNAQVGETGHWYVTFRAVDIEGRRGQEATKEVYVDNNAPEINSFKVEEKKETSIKVSVEAKDAHSGIEKIMYSLDGVAYSEGKEEYTFNNLLAGTVYRVYVKVIDKVGNESVVSIEVETELTEEQKRAREEEEERKAAGEGPDKDKEEEKEWDIPKIHLNEVPSVFEAGDNYELPSYYNFGNDEGSVVCLVDGKEAMDTSELTVGKHTIICTATSKHGKEGVAKKEVLVQVPGGEEGPDKDEGEIWDGWLKLNLYYPEESYNWQWRYGYTDNDIDEEYEDLEWEDYTGPILVKIEDIPKIYIRYDMEGKTFIIAPEGQALAEIKLRESTVTCGGTTEVTIEHDEDAKLVQYRINGGKWQEYTKPFEVLGNTQIEARTVRDEKVYNNLGEYQYTQEITGRDIKTVKEAGCTVPQNPDLSLSGIPKTVYLGEDRSLPSYYTYGTHGIGNVECVDEKGNNVINTRYMEVGSHTVTCNLEAGDGTKIGPVNRTFSIEKREYDPYVSLWDVPSKIVKGDNYRLPSYYSYGSHGTGSIVCTDQNGTVLTNTSSLEVGTYNITCIITAADGVQKSDNVTVDVRIGYEPYVDLNNLPSTIYLGEYYRLPSHYSYGRPNIGTLTCKVDGVELYDTHSLSLGSHNIECNITNSVGQQDSARKTITVVKRPVEPIPEAVLAGPIVSVNPAEVTTETDVVITPAEKASIIKYSFDNRTWNTYTEPFEVNANVTIYAYYVRQSDGKISQTTKYRVQNIKVPHLPYVKIDATYQDSNSKAIVTITGSDYDTLEYSLDGVIYQTYTGPITLTNSATVYAQATNSYGTQPDKLTVTLNDPPVILTDTLFIKIVANPNGTQKYPIKETEISILHSDSAEHVYYKLGTKGKWIEYTGPFTLTENTTVYAYAKNSKEKGNDHLIVDFLTTGIPDPVIILDPAPPKTAPKVKVHIDWGNLENSSTSTSTNTTTGAALSLGINRLLEGEATPKENDGIIRKYRIVYPDGTDSGWLDWTGDFEVDGNCTIEAYQEDSLGHISQTSTQHIENVVPAPEYTAVYKGDYYLLKLNYPSVSDASKREYKWKETGTWKKYDSKGILLIAQEKADKYDLTKDGVEIEDEAGNKVTIAMAHVYVLDVPASELSGNIFMRWDNSKPDAPTINVNKTSATTEVEVSISYPKQLLTKYYKIVEKDGTDSGWLEYTEPFKITKNNTTIYAYGKNRLEISSDIVSKTITNIDESNPEINITGNLETPKQQVNLTVTASDDQMLYMVKWAKGRRSLTYFSEIGEDKGKTIKNGSTVQIESNGYYTFFAVDQAGNEVVKEVEVTNIDLEAPDITISVLTSGITTQAQVSIDYGDSKTKQYSIGDNSSYQTYTDTLTISSYDYYQLANPDGTLTIYAKGIDEAGNITEVSEVIRCLDLDMPDEPTINLHMDHPTLSKDGFTTSNYVEVTYAARNDITNEISLDNGTTWKTYTGKVAITDETKVMARSRKTESGFTSSSEVNVTPAENTLLEAAYDEDNTTEQTISAAKKATLYVDDGGSSMKITIRSNGASGSTVKTYIGETLDKTITISSTIQTITLASGTTKVEIIAGSTALKVAEVVLNGVVEVVEGESILSIMQENELKAGYYNFKVDTEIYPVHLVEIDTDTISSNTCYGDSFDVGTANSNAENMVIALRKGDLTINGTDNGHKATVGPCYDTSYGGPKGFLLYVTGKLTVGTYGIIDNSHGAKAVGQDVLLWKNANGEFEKVPASGGTGGVRTNRGSGIIGNSGSGRQTGGGGSGATYLSITLVGGTGTSYSGGTGGAGAETSDVATKPSDEGGTGGSATLGLGYSGGGAGNPGGTPNTTNNAYKGANGTGGLLIIYASTYENIGKVTANGSMGGASYICPGGSSGGGSINIFYDQLVSKGSTSVNGGGAMGTTGSNNGITGGAGGAGTVTYMKIAPNVITFDANGGIVNETSRALTDGTAIGDLPVPTISDEDFLFDGWYTSLEFATLVTEDYVPSNNQTLYAKWDSKYDEEYSAIGSEQTYNVKKAGLYKIEVWGAQGGNYNGSHIGGYGGYSVGLANLTAGDTLYINVGKQGTNTGIGGYNGGGAGSPNAGGGGGATSISFASGILKKQNVNDLLIVAGGGGGSSWYTPNACQYAAGSSGGGMQGETAYNDTCNGRNQSSYSSKSSGGNQENGGRVVSQNQCGGSNGSFGQGGSTSCGFNSLGGGGGGYYGGATGTIGGSYNMLGATGGSGYIASDSLISVNGIIKHMYCYNCTAVDSTNIETYTISNGSSSCHNSEAQANCAKEGNGYVRITHLANNLNLTSSQLRQVENTLSANTITDSISKKADTPVVQVTTNDNSKTVTINVDTEYRKEYSLDLGNTWLEYTEPFEVSENTIVFTRVVDNDNKVLSSSTYTITTIVEKEKEEEPIEESTEVLPSEETPEVVEEETIEEEKPEGSEVDE